MDKTERVNKLVKGETYDWAVPIDWIREVHWSTGLWPSGSVVWLYDKQGGLCGRPYAIDMYGHMALKLASLNRNDLVW